MLKWTAQAVSFCRIVIDAKIAAGALLVPKAKGLVLFYAGPEKEIVIRIRIKRKDPAFSPLPNWNLAAAEATRLDANRIDETPLFKYLWSSVFEADLISTVGNSHFSQAKKYIWDYVSDRFSRETPFQAAATLICGASEKSSMRVKEILGMLANPNLRVVNKRDTKLFRDFRRLGKKEVFRLACMTNLLELRAHAKASNDNNAKELYKNQRDYFLAWRETERALFNARPQATRQWVKTNRKRVLANHCHRSTALAPEFEI